MNTWNPWWRSWFMCIPCWGHENPWRWSLCMRRPRTCINGDMMTLRHYMIIDGAFGNDLRLGIHTYGCVRSWLLEPLRWWNIWSQCPHQLVMESYVMELKSMEGILFKYCMISLKESLKHFNVVPWVSNHGPICGYMDIGL